MNSYIQSNLATEEAADIVLVAGAYDTVATDAAHSTSCVSTLDDAEGNMNTGPIDKKTDEEEEAALDDAERNIQKKGVSVLGCFLHEFIYDMNSYFK
jgi:hypothetical protein